MNTKINKDIAKINLHIKKQKTQKQIENRILNLLLWCSTECSDEMTWSRNKHYGQRYWSKKALEIFIKSKGKVTGVGLVHEHAIPKSVLIEEIKTCKTESEIIKLLNTFCIGVIVTKNEDKKFKSKMPAIEWKKKKLLFSRYTEIGIKVLDLNSKLTPISTELNNLLITKDLQKYKSLN